MRIGGTQKPRPALLATMLMFLIGSGCLSPILPWTGETVAASLRGDTLKGKVTNPGGNPVSGAQVQLLSPAKTMMDVTTTGKDGKFTLDLGVLEDDEMARLEKFFIVVSKKGKKVKKGLDSGTSSANGVVNVENIEFP